MSGWQPIETAPKDNREIAILIYAKHCGMYRVAYYDTEADSTYPWHVEDAAEGFNHHKDWPSHWRPLPDPPEK